jgi:hypothetical protein
MVAAVTSPKEAVDTDCHAEMETGGAELGLARDDTVEAFGAPGTHTMQKRNGTVVLPPLRRAAPPAAQDSDSLDDDDRFSLGDTTPGRLQRDLRNPNKPPLLADLVQNTAEYASGSIADLVSLRGVSHEFKNAVSDAVGFLNDRCWTSFEARDESGETGLLWASRESDEIVATNRCALVCLRHRLETLRWHVDRSRPPGAAHLPLELFGDANTVLTVLDVDANCIDADKLRNLRGLKSLSAKDPSGAMCFGDLPALESLTLVDIWSNLPGLPGCVALRELSLERSFVPDTMLRSLRGVLSQLVKLNLSECTGFMTVSNLAACVSLRELNLSHTTVADLRGLEELPALETLDLRGILTSDGRLLKQCARLRALSTDLHFDVPVEVQVRCVVSRHGPTLQRRRFSFKMPVWPKES